MGVAALPLAIGASAASTIVSASGQMEAGQASAQANAYKAQVAANNAEIARRNSIMDIQSGEIAAVNQGLKTRGKVGAEKAQQGASGIDVNSGSAAAVRAGTAQLGMLDALTIRSNAAKKSYSDLVEQSSDTAQSQLDTMASQQAGTAGEIGAAGTLLSGASSVAGGWQKYQNLYGSTTTGGGSSGPDLQGGVWPG